MSGCFAFGRHLVTRVLEVVGNRTLLLKWRAWESFHFGEREIRLLAYLVDPQRNAVDVGAAEGVYSFYLNKLALHCIAFEPNPLSALYLKRALPAVKVYEVAASTADGEATLRVPLVKGVPYRGWGTIE